MTNYLKSNIYIIKFYDNEKLIYIGSTICKLKARYSNHKFNNNCSLYQYIKEHYNGDFKNCYIELLENYECNNKQELKKKEGEFIRKYKADNNYIVINKNIAGRTIEEYLKDKQDAKIKLNELNQEETNNYIKFLIDLENDEMRKLEYRKYKGELTAIKKISDLYNSYILWCKIKKFISLNKSQFEERLTAENSGIVKCIYEGNKCFRFNQIKYNEFMTNNNFDDV
jgi:hypothetical protein